MFPLSSTVELSAVATLALALALGFGFGFALERAGFGRAAKRVRPVLRRFVEALIPCRIPRARER